MVMRNNSSTCDAVHDDCMITTTKTPVIFMGIFHVEVEAQKGRGSVRQRTLECAYKHT